jgi:hypothetical protein
MINLEDYEAEFNGKSYVPLSIAKKAVTQAYENSKEYKDTLTKLDNLNNQFKEAMKELGEGFEDLGNIKL